MRVTIVINEITINVSNKCTQQGANIMHINSDGATPIFSNVTN